MIIRLRKDDQYHQIMDLAKKVRLALDTDHCKWERDVDFDQYAAELLNLHKGTLEIEQKLSQLTDNNDDSFLVGKYSGNRCAEYLGGTVICQHGEFPIDQDSQISPKTLTTAETRAFSRLCLKGLLNETMLNVVATGHPGIGKTRAALAYALQVLLWKGMTVIRAGFKTNTAVLFLPVVINDEDEYADVRYETYVTETTTLESSKFCRRDEFYQMFVLIDPPQDKQYSCPYNCKMLKFAPYNFKIHLSNVGKGAEKFIMQLPTSEAVHAMSKVLWSENSDILEDEERLSPEDKATEIDNRCFLCGTALRTVFHKNFRGEIQGLYSDVKRTVALLKPHQLIRFYLGKPFAGRLFYSPESAFCYLFEPANEECQNGGFYLNAIAAFCASKSLKESNAKMVVDDAFYFERLCSILLKGGNWGSNISLPPRRIKIGANWNMTSSLIRNLRETELTLVRAARSYPILDFASDRTTWFSAKVGPGTPSIGLSAFCTVMECLELATYTKKEGRLCLNDENLRIKLYLIRNCDNEDYRFDETIPKKKHRLDIQQVKAVFVKHVKVKTINVTEWTPMQVLDAENERTTKLLRSYGVDV